MLNNSICKWVSLLNNIYSTIKYIKDICMSKKNKKEFSLNKRIRNTVNIDNLSNLDTNKDKNLMIY